MTRFHLYYAFFRSTWLLSILTGSIMSVLSVLSSGAVSVEMVEICLFLIPTAGLGMDFLYKELSQKEEYFFFYNQGIGKVRLWTTTFLFSAGSCFILYQIIRICVQAWKWIAS